MSAKTEIIERLFSARWSPDTRALADPVVTLRDVQLGIREYNTAHPGQPAMSDANPANFFKDFIRNKRRANANWPATVFEADFTARQLTGEGQCFEFVPLPDGAREPFPLDTVPGPSAQTTVHRIESASLPIASRRLGRNDESWLQQVLVRLRVIETHLSLFSNRSIEQVDHLQMNVKQAKSEIDALYLATERLPMPDARTGRDTLEIIVTCEAKGRRDDVLEHQILAQVRAAFNMGAVRDGIVVPMVAKAFERSRVHLIEFEAVTKDALPAMDSLVVASEAVYELVPPVPGIGV